MYLILFALLPDPPETTPTPDRNEVSRDTTTTNNPAAARKGEDPPPEPTGGGIEPAEDENEE